MKNRTIITNRQRKVTVTPKLVRLIKRAIDASLVYEDFKRRCEVSVTLVDNFMIHAINLEKRGIDRATDVLSFPMFDDDYSDDECCILGDIVLSLERADEQAVQYGHSFEREVAFLVVHSMLHLLGYDHELSPDAEKEMFWRQEEILKTMGLTRQDNNI